MPSQYIINSLAGYGMPIVLFLLVFIPTAADQRLISETKSARKIPLNWSINKQFTKIMLWMCGAAVLVAPILLYRLPIGIANLKDSKDTTTFLSHLGRFRGYDSSLRYLSPIDSKNENEMDKVEVITPYKSGKYTIYDFTVIGLGHLSQYGVSELKDSIREVQQGSSQGFYNDNNKIVPITLMKESLSPSEVPYIVLSGSDNKKPTVLRLLARSKIEDIPSLEYRNRLQTSELVRIKGSPNFKAPVPSDLVSSQMAEYFQTQISDFFWSQITNLMFIFLLLALYLNSFFRSILLLGFSAIPLSSFCLLQFVWPAPFDLDSLWILFTVPWLTLMLLIIVGRVIDTERWRGTDRDAAVMDTKEQFAPSAFLAILFLPTMIFVISLLSHIPIMSSVQLWKAGAFSAVIMAATLWLAIRHLFPLYYLEGEAFVENHLLRIYSFLQKTYSKGRKLGT